MPRKVAFYQDQRYLLSKYRSSEKYMWITSDPSLHIMDHPDCIVWSLMEHSICLKRVKYVLLLAWFKTSSTSSSTFVKTEIKIWAAAWDFQQFDILTSVDPNEPLQPPFKLRNSKWSSVSSLTIIKYSSDKQRLWSDCTYAQADLRLCCLHIPHCWNILAQIIKIFGGCLVEIYCKEKNLKYNHWLGPVYFLKYYWLYGVLYATFLVLLTWCFNDCLYHVCLV